MSVPLLQIQNLSVSFNHSPILEDINLAVYKNEILGLLVLLAVAKVHY